MLSLDGGRFLMGSDDPDGFPKDGEGPIREVELSPFWIDPLAVSNSRFGEFVDATGHITDAERYGWSFVFGGLLPDEFPDTRGIASAPWWRQVFDADWRRPEGPHSSVEDRLEHPVVHVSWRDARAFCAWAGLRLPGEAEWEFAARGGLVDAEYAWGDELSPGGAILANFWQGMFPFATLKPDGNFRTSAVGSFPPNGYGLSDMIGNVWEWTRDWYASAEVVKRGCCQAVNPRGATIGESYEADAVRIGRKVLKGGSHLCAVNYCQRYRPAARHPQMIDSATSHIGFRCVSRRPA
jgi:formylglycine-generating enzyme required for sulfatase activity